MGGKVTNQPMNHANMEEIVKTGKTEKIKAFSSKVIHTGTTTMFMKSNLHVMMHALCEGVKPLPHGLAAHNMYTEMRTGSKSIVVVMRNLTATPIMLKKITLVARLVDAIVVSITQIQSGMVA